MSWIFFPLPKTVNDSAGVVVPMPTLLPPSPLRMISPVVVPPRERDWLLVVARLPLPVRKVLAPATEPAMEAVGVPELTLRKANLAEAVACPPSSRSTVEFLGTMAPLVWIQ